MASTLVPGATFKIKLAYVKAVFQSLTSFVHLATLKIVKFLVVSKSSSFSVAIALHNVLLGVSAADIKTAFSVFGSVTHVVLKPVGVWYFSGFSPLSSLVSFSVVVGDPLMLFHLSSLESDLTKLSVLVESIVKPIGSLVTTFEQFINGDLVSSSVLGLRINEVLVHIGSFSRTVGKLERKVVFLKKKCYMEDIDMSNDSELLFVVSDKMFFNLMSLWKHEFVDVKTDLFKTAEWLVGLVSCSATLFSIIQKMLSLDKFSSVTSA
ncbi:hypothetical protein G9A89_004260 [Geosiphon pyriformis]|nr:hypothetical protein G9A89_004260 [Geosiphon pyriformis]